MVNLSGSIIDCGFECDQYRTGSTAKNGAGTVILCGSNTYTDLTTIGESAFLVNSSAHAFSTFSVETAATLEGIESVRVPSLSQVVALWRRGRRQAASRRAKDSRSRPTPSWRWKWKKPFRSPNTIRFQSAKRLIWMEHSTSQSMRTVVATRTLQRPATLPRLSF